MVSGYGCASGSRRRTRGHRTRGPSHRAATRCILGRVASVFHRRVRRTHRPRGSREPAETARMNQPLKLLMPLRVPELAPSLGRIIVPRRLLPPWVPLDDIREELATRVLELGAEGRVVARARTLEVTGRRAWAAAWDHAVRRAAARD